MDVAPAPRLGPALELTWHPREMDHHTVEKEALQEGGSPTVPGSDENPAAIQSTGMPVLSDPGEAHHASIYDFFQKKPELDRETVEKEVLQEGGGHTVPVSEDRRGAMNSKVVPGVDDKKDTNAMDPKDFRSYCIEGAVAVLGSMLFGMVFCCAVCLWWTRKRSK